MEFINNISIDDPIFCTNSGKFVFLDKPDKLDSPPKIDKSFINEKYVKLSTPESITQYFNNIPDMELVAFNGIAVYDGNHRYYCRYCKHCITDDWYYCYHCYNDTCKMCYSEVDDNGDAEQFKYTQAKLNKCRDCNQIKYRPIYNVIERGHCYCDVCSCVIDSFDERYTGRRNPDHTIDICMDCYENKENAKTIVETRGLKLLKKEDRETYLFNYTDFNSLYYWIPIIECDDGCRIFMNLNPDDKNYRKLCLQSCDKNDSVGYFIIYDESITLDVLLQKLKEITDKGVYEFNAIETIEEPVYEYTTTENEEKTYIDFDAKNSKYAKDYLIDEDGKQYYIKRSISNSRKTIKEHVYKKVIKTKEIGSTYHTGAIHLLMKQFNMPVYYHYLHGWK